jgi:hypothetical protein
MATELNINLLVFGSTSKAVVPSRIAQAIRLSKDRLISKLKSIKEKRFY